MFESLAEAEENRGLRGFKKRHFSEFVDGEQATSAVDELTKVFLFFPILQFVGGCVTYLNAGDGEQEARTAAASVLVFTLVAIFLVLWIRFRKNRILAVVHALLWIFNAVSVLIGPPPMLAIVLPGLFVAMSLRLAQACFAYHRFPRLAPIETATFD